MKLDKMLGKLQEQLAPKIDSSLSKEVLQAVSDAEGEALYNEVYRMSTSGRYERRWDNGGLLDPDNVQGCVTDGTLAVVNVTKPNPYLNGINRYGGLSTTPVSASLAGIVEHGVYDSHGAGYDYWEDAVERPFTTKTVEDLKKSGAHVAALRNGLRRQGIKTNAYTGLNLPHAREKPATSPENFCHLAGEGCQCKRETTYCEEHTKDV